MSALGGVNGTVCNAEQYQQSLFSYNSPNSSISCLTHGQSIGLAVSTRLCCPCPQLMIPRAADCRSIIA
jgi:hypothetical protein